MNQTWNTALNGTEQDIRQKICDDLTQLQSGLQAALQKIFEQAGNRIEPAKQEEVQQKVEGTKQLLENFKSRYA
jgi:hypothetical protein